MPKCLQLILYALMLWGFAGIGSLFAEPSQGPLPPQTLHLQEAVLEVKASFQGEFLVLSSKHYDDPISRLCPVDLVLGWGPFMHPNHAELLNITQKNRHFMWIYWGERWSENEIVKQTSNVHLIPADESIREKIQQLKKFQKIRIEGNLVDVTHPQLTATWKTSLVRSDKGTGACEILHVESITVLSNE